MARPKARNAEDQMTSSTKSADGKNASKGIAKSRFDLEKGKLLLSINRCIHYRVTNQLAMLLSSCQRSLTAVKKKYEDLIKLCIYLHGEADADLIQNLEEHEETLDKAIKCLTNNRNIVKEMDLNSTKMISCPALTDNSWPHMKALIEYIFLKEQLVKQISNYQEAQEIITKTKSSTGEDGIRFDGRLVVVKGWFDNTNGLESHLKATELQIHNLTKQLNLIVN